MNRRLFGMSVSSAAIGIAQPLRALAASGPIDNGEVELAVECLINHAIGERFVTVLFSLQSNQYPKELRLSANGAIEVNGTPLALRVDSKGTAYFAKVPFTGSAIRFVFNRTAQKQYSFTVDLALFKIAQYPETLRSTEMLKFRMETPHPMADSRVLEDRFFLDAYTKTMKFPYWQSKLPSDSDPELQLTPILKNIPQIPGRSEAKLLRQHRIPMSKISSDFQRGYILISVSDTFHINVLG
jgi:hypothetical protein